MGTVFVDSCGVLATFRGEMETPGIGSATPT